MLTWNFCGTVRHIANIAHDYDKRAEKSAAAAEWMSGQHSDSVLYPGLGKFPGPLQRPVLQEREEGEILAQERQDPRDFASRVACDSLFWQQYQLPCPHLFQVDMLTGQMNREERWEEVRFQLLHFLC